jgi:4Fe-4S ferredoxin
MRARDKRETRSSLRLTQRYITGKQERILDKEGCLGCGICADVCTMKAITLSEATVEDGRLVKRPEVTIDASKCVMGGTCAVFCPSGALNVTVEGAEAPPVLTYEVIPILKKSITVDVSGCNIGCWLACQESCPVDVIEVKAVTDDGEIRIADVVVNKARCIYCKRCVTACPYTLIEVERPFDGVTEMDVSMCPEGCMVCVDACPSEALKIGEDGKPVLEEEYCIFCSTCEKVCPEDAVVVRRTSVACSDVKSGAWFAALEKLTSPEVLSRELGIDASKHRKEIVRNRYTYTFPRARS